MKNRNFRDFDKKSLISLMKKTTKKLSTASVFLAA